MTSFAARSNEEEEGTRGEQLILELWRRRVQVIGTNLAVGELQHREIANAGAAVGADYEGRFLVELLQNATDQATRARLDDARVLIVRTAGLVAVLNQGRSLSRNGLERVSSLALSDKNPALHIGNKGVGFKSVFCVSKAPEIFSSGDDRPLSSGARLRFALDEHVFDSATAVSLLQEVVEDVLATSNDLRRELEQAHHHAAEALVAELTRWAPGWKFPLPLGPERFQERSEELGVTEDLGAYATMVVLPVSPAKRAGIEQRLQELEHHGASTMLFLPAVSRVEIRDRVRGRVSVLERRTRPLRTLDRHTRLESVETECRVNGKIAEASSWWRASRTIGLGCDHAARQKRAQIRRAAAQLPGPSWKRVRTADVAVAVPLERSDNPELPEASGVFCIGLPTTVPTGTAYWVDGRFHGNVSRTQIAFERPYNDLLVSEALRLLEQVFDEFRSSAELATRLWLTLSLRLGTGELARRLSAPGGLAGGPVVLDRAGRGYVAAGTLRLPSRENLGQLERCGLDESMLVRHGFVLPHREVLRRGWEILEGLGARPPPGIDGRLTARVESASLLERAAERGRADGRPFWESFLGWVLVAAPPPSPGEVQYEQLLKRGPPTDRLADQRILPIAGGGLARASERVFLAPYQGTEPDGASEEVDADGMPETVRAALRFLDEEAVEVRVGLRRTLSQLASALEDRKLVHAPRIDRLIADAVLPRLAEASADPSQRGAAVALLRQAVSWLQRMRSAKVDRSLLLVPVKGDEGWRWISAGDAYFGEGWLSDGRSRTLALALGARMASRLVPWSEFSEYTPVEGKEWWISRLRDLGVADLPRVRSVAPTFRFAAYSYEKLSPRRADCPFHGVGDLWARYLQYAATRRAQYKNGREYQILDECFVDGLDTSDTREHAVRLMLENPEPYLARRNTRTCRGDESDPCELETFWLFALKRAGWRVLPCTSIAGDSLEAPAEAWRLDEAGKRDGLRLLPCVRERYRSATELLGHLDVCTLATAPGDRLVAGLHRLASLGETVTLDHQREAIALATALYDQLQRQLRGGWSNLAVLSGRPVPLLVGDDLRALDLNSISRLYVDDDPVRARFVADFAACPRLPVSDDDVGVIVAALRKLLGANRVVLTSEAPTDVRFTPSPGLPDRPFLDYIDAEVRGTAARLHIAALIAYGTASASAGTREFRERWGRFLRLRLRFGDFADDCRAFYDEPAGILLVREGLPVESVIAASWQAAGEGYRNAFAAYASALRENATAAFFAEQRINGTRIHRVEREIGSSRSSEFGHVRTAFFAVWRRAHPAEAINAFDEAFEAASENDRRLASFLGECRLESVLGRLGGLGEEEASVLVLRESSVPFSEWQASRAQLGLAPWTFDCTSVAFASARALLVAALRSDAAEHANPGPEVLDAMFSRLPLAPSAKALLDVVDESRWLRDLVRLAGELLPDDNAAQRLRRELGVLAAAPLDRAGLLGRLGTEREVNVYLSDPEPRRCANAVEVVRIVTELARALAPHRNEALTRAQCEDDARVVCFSSGPYANRFGVLKALQQAIAAAAPETARALSGARVFHATRGRAELWAEFPELGLLDAPTKPEKTVEVLDARDTIVGLRRELSRGSAGQVGRTLAANVDPVVDLAALRDRERAPVPEKAPRNARRSGTGTGRGGMSAPPAEELQLYGDLGEAFVFEQLKARLGEWDMSCWVSGARARYGFSEDGVDDSAGFDFRYPDREGVLGGVPGATCLIEVKSSVGDCAGPFPISVNEWERAHAAHERRDEREIYLVLRVANVRTGPRLVDILRDPIQLRKDGKLRVEEQGLWATAG